MYLSKYDILCDTLFAENVTYFFIFCTVNYYTFFILILHICIFYFAQHRTEWCLGYVRPYRVIINVVLTVSLIVIEKYRRQKRRRRDVPKFLDIFRTSLRPLPDFCAVRGTTLWSWKFNENSWICLCPENFQGAPRRSFWSAVFGRKVSRSRKLKCPSGCWEQRAIGVRM